jgi:hypothetical protein
MALVRRTMESVRRVKPRVNRAKIEATSEADIRRHMRADDQEETNLASFTPVIPPQLLRKRLGMTQGEFAKGIAHSAIHFAQLGAGPGRAGPGCAIASGYRG